MHHHQPSGSTPLAPPLPWPRRIRSRADTGGTSANPSRVPLADAAMVATCYHYGLNAAAAVPYLYTPPPLQLL